MSTDTPSELLEALGAATAPLVTRGLARLTPENQEERT